MDSKRRPAPKLRTKTGCFMCRKRRKKCEEQKPICHDCKRNGLKCVWPIPPSASARLITAKSIVESEELRDSARAVRAPSSDSDSDTPFSDDSAKLGVTRSAVYGLPNIHTSMEHHLSLYLVKRYMPTLFRPHKHPGFGDYGPLVVAGARIPTMMETLLALAANHASWTNAKFKPIAIRYYNSVLGRLRGALNSRQLEGDEDWLLFTTNFLLLFESQHCREASTPSGVSPHLAGLARILKIRCGKYLSDPTRKPNPNNRTATESLFFHASCESLYYGEIDQVAENMDWNELSNFLKYDYFPGASSYQNSPVLGVDWKLYYIMSEVTQRSHRVPLSPADSVLVERLEIALDKYEGNITLAMKDEKDDKAINCLQETKLYILATQILIFKTLQRKARTSDSRIRMLLRDALDILKDLLITWQCSAYFTWPLAVFSCAVQTKEDMSFVRKTIEKVSLASYTGHVHRLLKAADIFWKRFRIGESEDVEERESEDEDEDLLDVLIYPRGMFGHPYLKTWKESDCLPTYEWNEPVKALEGVGVEETC